MVSNDGNNSDGIGEASTYLRKIRYSDGTGLTIGRRGRVGVQTLVAEGSAAMRRASLGRKRNSSPVRTGIGQTVGIYDLTSAVIATLLALGVLPQIEIASSPIQSRRDQKNIDEKTAAMRSAAIRKQR